MRKHASGQIFKSQPSVATLAQKIRAVPIRSGRRVIAIAGPPASGKSTLAELLAEALPNAKVLPMDGYHHSNKDLEAHGLLARKGAPQTFDVAGFAKTVSAIRTDARLSFATFDRENDCVVPNGGHLNPSDETILVEGNYVLLDQPEWSALSEFWDLTVMLDAPFDVLSKRLIQRWITYGHSPAQAEARAELCDLPNARLVQTNSILADVVVSSI